MTFPDLPITPVEYDLAADEPDPWFVPDHAEPLDALSAIEQWEADVSDPGYWRAPEPQADPPMIDLYAYAGVRAGEGS